MDRERNRLRVQHLRARLRGKEPPVHGRSGYDNYGCKCPVCKEAKSRANADYDYRTTLARLRNR